VSRNPVTLLILALAMLLAPLGTCMAWGHAQSGKVTAAQAMSGMHHAGMERHQGSVQHHFCSACQPLFTGAGKAGTDAGPQLASLPAIVPIPVQLAAPWAGVHAHSWYGRAPPIPPPLPITARVRLQI
jgi:hypothetical protein